MEVVARSLDVKVMGRAMTQLYQAWERRVMSRR